MTAAFGLGVILAVSMGTIQSGPDRGVSECPDPGAEQAAVWERVDRLRTGSHWIARRRAARFLRNFDWRQYPEAVEALADALRCDRQGLVRQEAAESLGKMKACLPVAHESLAFAAENDPSLIARHSARKALKAVGKACIDPCDVCEGADMVIEELSDEVSPVRGGPVPSVVPETNLDPLAPASLTVPSMPSAPSPFVPVGEPAFPARPPVRAPRVDPGDSHPLAPPTVPMDRYDPRPDEAPPTPVDDDAPAPRVEPIGRPGQSTER